MAIDSSSQPAASSYRTLAARHGAAFFFLVFGIFILLLAWQEHGRWRAPPKVIARTSLHVPQPAPAHAQIVPRKKGAEKKEPHTAMYHRLGAYVAHRYRISVAVATDIVEKAHAVGHKLKLDPLLLLAIISVESRFDPGAESTQGAKGLMQVMPRWHADKLNAVGGEEKVFDLEPNILVGARILKEYLLPTGELADALQRYLGTSSEEAANEYSEKIARERELLAYVARKGAAPGTAL